MVKNFLGHYIRNDKGIGLNLKYFIRLNSDYNCLTPVPPEKS